MPKIADLQKQVTQLDSDWSESLAETRKVKEQLAVANATIKEVRAQFGDLKQRLQAAETANQYMRGYLARVQEDDVVREELVTTGEPDGEQRMVPKRKPTEFNRPSDFTESSRDDIGMGSMSYIERQRERKARHWITY